MQTEDSVEKRSSNKQKHKKTRSAISVAGVIACAVIIFFAGVGFGGGQVGLGAASKHSQGLSADLDYSSVEKLYDQLRTNYDGNLDTQKLLDGMKAGLAQASGDPYTVYLNQKQASDFANELNGTFSGIGAEIGKDASDNLIVVSPIAGFPAAKAGLRPQDIIAAIDDESTSGLSVEEAVTKIRGPKDTSVSLRVIRNKKEEKTFTITRADITIPSVKSEMLDGKIGYLQITQFGEDTASLSAQAAKKFKDDGAKAIILDLRGDPGGLLDASVSVASLWLNKGDVILQQKSGGTVVSTERANSQNTLRGLPTVVLVNEGSASAAEIVAGALKDHNVATLIGVKTFGKGSVQELLKLNGGGELKVTVARWYRPNGENIDKKGVKPDQEVKMTEEDITAKRDPQKAAAIEFLKK